MYVWFLLFRRFLLFCLRALPIFNFLFIFALRCENQSPCLIFVNIRRLWVTIASNTLGASGFLVDQNKNGKKRRKDFLRSGHSSTCAEKKRKSHGIVRETSKQTHCSGLLFPIRYVFDVLTPLNGCDDDVCVENVMLGREKKRNALWCVCYLAFMALLFFRTKSTTKSSQRRKKANFRPTQNAQFKWMWKDVNWDTTREEKKWFI